MKYNAEKQTWSYTGGGTTGSWTLAAARRYIDRQQPGFSVDGHRGSYTATDDCRPGLKWHGRTPAAALRESGLWMPKNSIGY